MIQIETIEVTPIQQNCRVVYDTESKSAVVVDPGGDVDLIVNFLNSQSLKLEAIWLTHSHYDHCGGVATLLKKLPVKLFGHIEGRLFREAVEYSASRFGGRAKDMSNCPEPDVYLNEGDNLQVGGHKFQVFYTPGHAPDHLVFYYQPQNTLIAGDTVFRQSIGRTDLPGGNYQLLIESIRNKILTLPEKTEILPGHGPNTTVGFEKSYNQFLR